MIQGNRIGTTADGAGALANQDGGIEGFTDASGVTVGGTGSGAGNNIAQQRRAWRGGGRRWHAHGERPGPR